MKKYAFMLGVILVFMMGWFFLSPLAIDETVNESFDFVGADGAVDLDMIMAMPVGKRELMKGKIMQAAARAPDQAMRDDMPTGGPRVVSSGTFVDADRIHKGTGRAILYALPDNTHVVRFEDFRTTNGPALVVYLAKHPAPASASDVTDGGFVKLGKLKGNVGNQNYRVPAGTDVAQFHSVVIWCELFDVLFSPAALIMQ
ncbi:MAG: DM13 domain-containing protein [Gammaproteobacteria bacterium]|nr:DM13 domain-containing protein [Gammaproteobacteria bacterium]